MRTLFLAALALAVAGFAVVFALPHLNLGTHGEPDLDIDQTQLCHVESWRADEVAKACKPGQKIVFAPHAWGNDQAPVIFAATSCDLRYAVALTAAGVTCIYKPSAVPKDWQTSSADDISPFGEATTAMRKLEAPPDSSRAAERRAEAKRQAQRQRAAELAGAGTDNSGARRAGPSGGYAAQIRAAVRPNIVFNERVPGDPVAHVQVQTDRTGRIISTKIVKSSGVKAWDDAVLRALDRTGSLPSDQGRFWNPIVIEFHRRD